MDHVGIDVGTRKCQIAILMEDGELMRDRARSVARRVFAIVQQSRTATLRTGHAVREASKARMRRL